MDRHTKHLSANLQKQVSSQPQLIQITTDPNHRHQPKLPQPSNETKSKDSVCETCSVFSFQCSVRTFLVRAINFPHHLVSSTNHPLLTTPHSPFSTPHSVLSTIIPPFTSLLVTTSLVLLDQSVSLYFARFKRGKRGRDFRRESTLRSQVTQ